MRKYYLFTIILLAFVSCKTKTDKTEQQETFESKEFVFTNLTTDDFVTKAYGDERSLSYETIGKIKNNTNNFYSSTFITVEIRLVLENGNILTNNDIDPHPMLFNDIGGMISGDWEPGKEETVKLETPRMTSSYVKYPISKIFIDYNIHSKDKINNTEINEIFKTIDVTEKWKTEKEKFINKQTDFDVQLKKETEKRDSITKTLYKYVE